MAQHRRQVCHLFEGANALSVYPRGNLASTVWRLVKDLQEASNLLAGPANDWLWERGHVQWRSLRSYAPVTARDAARRLRAGLNDLAEVGRNEARPPDQCTVYIRLMQQLSCVGRLHTSAVLDANLRRRL